MPIEKEPKRAVVTYRTREFSEGAKWSLWCQRLVDAATDTGDVIKKFFATPTWPALTGSIEIKSIEWID